MRLLLSLSAIALLTGCMADPMAAQRRDAMFAAWAQQPLYAPAQPMVLQPMHQPPQPIYIVPAPGTELNAHLRDYRNSVGY
jgi:hypothetical protein